VCGIVGVFRRISDSSPSTVKLLSAVSSLRHRGPDSSGEWSGAPLISLGHRRLAVVDLSETGHQPMSSSDGQWTMSYNGEIYNSHDIRDRFTSVATAFRGHSDTEVLVEALAQSGPLAVVPALDGMFSFAAWDAGEGHLWLARDRFGEKPLYYWSDDERVLFGS